MYVNRLDPVAPASPPLSVASTSPAERALLAAHAVTAGERAAWGPADRAKHAPAAHDMAAPSAPRAASKLDSTTLAELAQDVYLDVAVPPSGFHVATKAELARVGVTPAMLADQPNGFRARAYVQGSGDDAQVVIAFRGSQQSGDWVANARQAVGLNTDHYSRALQLGRAVAQSGVENVTFAGHSLGGGLASAAGLASGAPASTFNAAGLSAETIDQAQAIRGASGRTIPDIRAYYVRGEVLSALQDGGDRIAGALLFGPLGSRVDAPEAVGTRVPLEPVTPQGKRFWNDNAIDRHGMEWVIASLRGR
ncbi:hypothetical protein ACMGDM_18965 [Sphingomonas sp. DT-51]|uniref:hypothetical protein n=1 Tax=Sphingomonas sp. DT-51 TaxID=3396165 RepID=UPI003F1CED6C